MLWHYIGVRKTIQRLKTHWFMIMFLSVYSNVHIIFLWCSCCHLLPIITFLEMAYQVALKKELLNRFLFVWPHRHCEVNVFSFLALFVGWQKRNLSSKFVLLNLRHFLLVTRNPANTRGGRPYSPINLILDPNPKPLGAPHQNFWVGQICSLRPTLYKPLEARSYV